MRRSICVCEPNVILAGNSGNWKFTYTTANHLPKGTKLRFDLGTKGGPLHWQIPQTNLKKKENLIWAEFNGKKFGATEAEIPGKETTAFEFTIPAEVKQGESFTIHIGAPEQEPDMGNKAQKITQRKRPFNLSIDPKGKGDYKETETFYLDVRGNKLTNLRVVAPSLVSRNKRFDLIVRFEDEYGNLTANAPEGTLIDLSYEHLRENLNWKLFIPETGFIALPNLYFNEPGIYRIQLRNLSTKEIFFSPPIKCLGETPLNLFWGSLHAESDRVPSKGNIEALLRHMRDEKAYQFFATSPLENEKETSNEMWKAIGNQVSEFNEEGRFVAFQGFLWEGEPKEEGLRLFIYAKDNKPLLRFKESKNNSLKKIYKINSSKDLLSVPLMTMGKKMCYNFADFDPDFEKVVEIYSGWGSSECLKKEGNEFPITGSKQGISETPEGSIVKALNQGLRFGFIAGGRDHRATFEGLLESGQKEYHPGLTAILAKDHHRSSMFEALQSRSTYATTGARIILGFEIAGFGMGQTVDTKNRPGLIYNRHICAYAIGTAPIETVQLIRNGAILKEFKPGENQWEESIDDMDPLEKVTLEPSKTLPPFVYYYLRVKQEDGHVAWSSPIWVEMNGSGGTAPLPKKSKKK